MMYRTNFKLLLSEIVAKKFDDEKKALHYLIGRMLDHGYVVDTKTAYLLSAIGGCEFHRIDRVKNGKKFRANQIKHILKDSYDHIKIMNNKELQEEIERRYREEEKEREIRFNNTTYEQMLGEYIRECQLYGDDEE